jgi:hypothetical protein
MLSMDKDCVRANDADRVDSVMFKMNAIQDCKPLLHVLIQSYVVGTP